MLNGGTGALHQQLIFRLTPGLGRPKTPIAGLYLASSSAHPGGGVEGACGPTPPVVPSGPGSPGGWPWRPPVSSPARPRTLGQLFQSAQRLNIPDLNE
jgi:hypothetical protein